MKSWQYPDWLYCENCENDVPVVLTEKTEEVTHTGTDGKETPVTLRYTVAVCPYCGRTVCERDRHYAFLRASKTMNTTQTEETKE